VNDAPVINAFTGPTAPVAAGASIAVNGSFTDVDLADVPMTESHTVTIDWGDGTPTTIPSLSGSGATRSLSANHAYADLGVFTVTLTVTDAAGETATATHRYVVVFDPNAGFVTGGGWINSPAGAYAADPTLTGKATFGFVSKYKKGQTLPDGNTEFQFHAASFNFKSSAYEWLVVAGARGQFKGTGTINGSGNFGFMLTAIDGQVAGGGGTDKFRMKVWNISTGAVIYDNQPGASDDTTTPIITVLGGGSINIQAK
jgi:PKD repeat protein